MSMAKLNRLGLCSQKKLSIGYLYETDEPNEIAIPDKIHKGTPKMKLPGYRPGLPGNLI
jgi:hypothetical protein